MLRRKYILQSKLSYQERLHSGKEKDKKERGLIFQLKRKRKKDKKGKKTKNSKKRKEKKEFKKKKGWKKKKERMKIKTSDWRTFEK